MTEPNIPVTEDELHAYVDNELPPERRELRRGIFRPRVGTDVGAVTVDDARREVLVLEVHDDDVRFVRLRNLLEHAGRERAVEELCG